MSHQYHVYILWEEGWTSCLKQLPPFCCGCLYAHLVTDSKTIAEKQQCTAAAAKFGAGAMKHIKSLVL